MIQHVVMFKLKNGFSPAEKEENALRIKNALEALPAKIAEIQHFKVGINENPSPSAFDLVLVSSFRNVEELHEYAVNPWHRQVVALIDELCQDRAVVDYQD